MSYTEERKLILGYYSASRFEFRYLKTHHSEDLKLTKFCMDAYVYYSYKGAKIANDRWCSVYTIMDLNEAIVRDTMSA